ncbi:uncharacterized protein [Elaeis guineensis]|uniref:uncharacterized protein isoform X2 n=1 Tax=Elaeis guineensis var. tenera TaxID=51953 RepID=UPI003C6CCAC3
MASSAASLVRFHLPLLPSSLPKTLSSFLLSPPPSLSLSRPTSSLAAIASSPPPPPPSPLLLPPLLLLFSPFLTSYAMKNSSSPTGTGSGRQGRRKRGALRQRKEPRNGTIGQCLAAELPIPKLSVKEKKELASYAHNLGKKLKCQQVGKAGVTPSVAASFIETLEANELLKLTSCHHDASSSKCMEAAQES